MSYSHLSKEIMLLKLKMKRNSFTNYFTISFKRNYRNFDAILKTLFKKLNSLFNFFYRSAYSFYVKKNNKLRFYIDYRELNTIIIKNRHFLFLIFETLNRLCDSKIFTKLNFKNVYYKLYITNDDE